jgi:hypothetical protein
MSGSPALQRRPRLLIPVLSLTDRLRTRSRLLLLVALLLVPSLLAAGSFALVIGGQVQFAQDERAGVQVVAPAVQAMATSAVGDSPDLTDLRAAVADHPALEAEEALLAVLEAPDAPAQTEALAAMVAAVGDSSKLILDPDLDSYYVMDALVVQLPRALAAVGSPPDARGNAGAVATRALEAACSRWRPRSCGPTSGPPSARRPSARSVTSCSRCSRPVDGSPCWRTSRATTWTGRRARRLRHRRLPCVARTARRVRSQRSSTPCSSVARTRSPCDGT